MKKVHHAGIVKEVQENVVTAREVESVQDRLGDYGWRRRGCGIFRLG